MKKVQGVKSDFLSAIVCDKEARFFTFFCQISFYSIKAYCNKLVLEITLAYSTTEVTSQKSYKTCFVPAFTFLICFIFKFMNMNETDTIK